MDYARAAFRPLSAGEAVSETLVLSGSSSVLQGKQIT